jgi:IS66 Orf2 like protein
MIQISPQMRILVAIEAVDGRKGIDSLARLCQENLQADPFSGCLVFFRSRRGMSIRILVYDGQGFCGWRKSGSRRGVLCGGRGGMSPPGYWRPIRHRCC